MDTIKIIAFATVLALAGPVMTTAQTIKGYYPDGAVKSEFKAPASPQAPSQFVIYYQNRMMLTEGESRHGIVSDGQRMAWYDNGNRQYEFTMQGGLMQGMLKMYYADGSPKLEGEFSKGRATGYWKLWNDKGVMMLSGEMLPDGRFRIIEARDVFRLKVIDQGEGDMLYYRQMPRSGETVTVKVEGKYLGGLKEGLWTVSTAGGMKIEEAWFTEGRYNGKHLLYNPDGSVAEERHYNKGIPSGKWTINDSKGKLIKVEEYTSADTTGTHPHSASLPDDEMTWQLPFGQTLPFAAPGNAGLQELVALLFVEGMQGNIQAYKDFGARVPLSAACIAANGMIDTLSVPGLYVCTEPTVHQHLLSDASGLDSRELAFASKQYGTVQFRQEVIGVRFGRGNDAVTPIWFSCDDVINLCAARQRNELSDYGLGKTPGLITPLRTDERPANAAEALYLSETTLLTLQTEWFFQLEAQLNLKSVNRQQH